ncbi:hypothetical protein vseg_014144 [Gypsophila vaccaria]
MGGYATVHQNTSILKISTTLSSSSSSSSSSYSSLHNKHILSNLTLPRVPLRRCFLSLARRRSNSASSNKPKSRKTGGSKKDADLGEDAFEALFKQLEEDLKKDGELVDDDEEEITEEELALLERELGEALAFDEDLSDLLNMAMGTDDAIEVEAVVEDVEDDNDEDDDDDEEEEDEDADEDEEAAEPIKLRGWQLRRLAYALKVGRRKTSIKKLAAELCLDRAIVLELLREPPPDLLMMCAALPDKEEPVSIINDSETIASVPSEEIIESDETDGVPNGKPEPKTETPIHVLQGSWSAQKRLKKVQVETLENVYRRTKRPTNTMISSIVHVTNLPRRRVVKWFEDKRTADGVPEEHHPYRRSASDTVFAK